MDILQVGARGPPCFYVAAPLRLSRIRFAPRHYSLQMGKFFKRSTIFPHFFCHFVSRFAPQPNGPQILCLLFSIVILLQLSSLTMTERIDISTLQANGQLCDAEIHIGESVNNINKLLFVQDFEFFHDLFLDDETADQKLYKITEPWLTSEVFQSIIDHDRESENKPKFEDLWIAVKNLGCTSCIVDSLMVDESHSFTEENSVISIFSTFFDAFYI